MTHLTTKDRLFGLPLAAIVMVLAGCHASNTEQATSEVPPQEVSYLVATPTNINEFSELPGRLNASKVAQIRARVPGIIVHQVQGGMDVKQGQLLFSIDPSPLKAAYDSAEANLQKTLATQMQAQTKSERYKSLVAFNAVSKQDYIDSIASAQLANAEVAAARAALKSAKLNLDYASVTAPIHGYMGRPLVTEGDLVGQGEATLLATVQQIDPIYLDLTQSSNDVLRIRQALKAGKLKTEQANTANVTLILDDGSHYPYTGKLLFSDISVDSTTSMVTLRAQFPNPEHLLLPGMYARALVEASQSQPAILLPQRAVIRGENGSASVMVLNNQNIVEEVKVKLGDAQKDQWIINDGLHGGEHIIIEGLQKIAPGAVTKPNLFQAPEKEVVDKLGTEETPTPPGAQRQQKQ